MSYMSEVEKLEKQLEDAKFLISRKEMALKLYDNHEFRKLIVEEFMGSEAARYAQASGDPALDPVQRQDALNMAQASGHLKRFLSLAVTMASVAERDLPELEAAIEQARQEEGEE